MSKLFLILSYISVLLSSQSSFSHCNSADEDEIISEFQRYLRFPTAHPNPNYKPAQEFIVSKAKSIGLNTQILEYAKGKPIILLTWTGKNPSWPSILLNSHLDSVPAEPEKWVHDPFQAIKDIQGNIYARGSQDDKCIGVQYLEAISRLKTKGYQPLRTVHVSFVPDEEIGGRDGAEAFVSSKEFKILHVGFALDEGQACPDENYRVFYADRVPWKLIITATGAPGHGSKLYDNSAFENLMKSMEAIARFRSAQFDLVKAGLAEPGEVIAVNPVFVKAGTPTPTGFVMNLSELLVKQSRLVRTSEEKIIESFKQAENIGFRRGSKMFALFMRTNLGVRKEDFDRRLRCLSSWGFSENQVSKFVRWQPSILALSEENLKRKVDFLVKSARLPLAELVKYQRLLGYSLETRIIPRFRVMEALKSMQEKVLKKERSFASIALLKEECFLDKYVNSNAKSSVLRDIYNSAKLESDKDTCSEYVYAKNIQERCKSLLAD